METRAGGLRLCLPEWSLPVRASGRRSSRSRGVGSENTRAETYKINPSILLRNALLESAPSELLVLANVRVDGIFLHVTRSSWWPPEALADALRALKQHVIGWYHRVGRIDYLAAVAETAIREKASLVDVIEPMDRSATALPWAPDPPLRLGSALF
jgi:hypothetical protein